MVSHKSFVRSLRVCATWTLCLGVLAGVSRVSAAPIDFFEGRPQVNWEDADKVIGRIALVSGKIVKVGQSGRVNFLNFDAENSKKFTAVVFAPNLSKFPEPLEKMYEGKIVRVRGLVTTFSGKAQIEVSGPDQIEVLAEPPVIKPLEAPKPWSGQEVTIGTYNLLNLFDDFDDPYHNDQGTPAKPRDEMEHVAGIIRQLNADVLALEEVESRDYLQRFVDVFLADLGYQVVHFEGNDLRGIDVCLLSRVPVGPVRSFRHVTFPGPKGEQRKFERDLLCVQFDPPGGKPFEVWVVHLKSNHDGREVAEPLRIAEAKMVRRQLDERLAAQPEARIIVTGDFNDTWESTTIRTVVGSGATAMKCFAEEISEQERITYNKEPYRSMIDFLLSSPAISERYVKGSYRILPGSVETSGSDHNPVSARYRVE